MKRPLAVILAASAVGGSIGGLAAATASAISAPIQITSTVNIRPGPSTTSGSPIGAIPTGASPDYNCWVVGQNVSGVNVWFYVNYGGVIGYYASYWDNSHYASDYDIPADYAIPQCQGTPPSSLQGGGSPQGPTVNPQGGAVNPQGGGGSQPSPAPSGPSAAERAAVAWATPYATSHSRSYEGLCLEFVDRAYSHAGISIRNEIRVPVNGNTYPLDIWGHFSGGRTGTGTPPYGALVFFEPKSGSAAHRRDYSHVALSVGGGTLISTEDSVATPVHYESMAQHSYAQYLGWWLPA
jgi:uncharacterized protein YraI